VDLHRALRLLLHLGGDGERLADRHRTRNETLSFPVTPQMPSWKIDQPIVSSRSAVTMPPCTNPSYRCACVRSRTAPWRGTRHVEVEVQPVRIRPAAGEAPVVEVDAEKRETCH